MTNFIKQWIINRQLKKLRQSAITDEMREKALSIRRLQMQITALEKQVQMKRQLEVLEDALGVSETGNFEEKLVMGLLQKFLIPATSNNATTIQQTEAKTSLSNEEIEKFINLNPQLLKSIKDYKLNIADIEIQIRQKAPNIDDESATRAAQLIFDKVQKL